MVSGDDALVGSFNLDPRSYLANLESTVVVRGCRAPRPKTCRRVDRIASK